MVLVPVVLTYALLALAGRALLPTAATGASVAIAFGALWLLSDRLQSLEGPGAFFVAVGIVVGIAVASAVCSSGLDVSFETIGIVFMCGVGSCCLLLALVVARFFCRGRYSIPRFMSWLLLSLVLVFTCLIAPFALIASVSMGAWQTLFVPFAGGAAAGVVTYLAVLPFMILTFNNYLYRDRFNAIFRIEQIRSEQPVDSGEADKEMTE